MRSYNIWVQARKDGSHQFGPISEIVEVVMECKICIEYHH